MSRVTRVLLLVALVVPVLAYVVGSLAAPGGPEPADRGPVILRDAPTTPSPTSPTPAEPPGDDGRPTRRDDQQGEARVVTPAPTPVGEDDDDEWDDDGPDDDDDTDDARGSERDDD